jgi:hypothetical protein
LEVVFRSGWCQNCTYFGKGPLPQDGPGSDHLRHPREWQRWSASARSYYPAEHARIRLAMCLGHSAEPILRGIRSAKIPKLGFGGGLRSYYRC